MTGPSQAGAVLRHSGNQLVAPALHPATGAPMPSTPQRHPVAQPISTNAELHGTIQINEPGVSDHLFDLLGTLAWIIFLAILIFIFRRHVVAYLNILRDRLRTIDTFVTTMSRYPRSAIGLLAIAYDVEVDLIAERQNLEQMVSRGGPPILIRTFKLAALAQKYNVAIAR
jgi:hypothetical protein